MTTTKTNLKTLIELLDTFPGKIGLIEIDQEHDEIGVKSTHVKCLFSGECYGQPSGYISYGIDSFDKFGSRERYPEIPGLGVPAIYISMLYNGMEVSLKLTTEEIVKDFSVLESICHIMGLIYRLLKAKKKRWNIEEDPNLCHYDMCLSIREIENAQFLCNYIKERIKFEFEEFNQDYAF